MEAMRLITFMLCVLCGVVALAPDMAARDAFAGVRPMPDASVGTLAPMEPELPALDASPAPEVAAPLVLPPQVIPAADAPVPDTGEVIDRAGEAVSAVKAAVESEKLVGWLAATSAVLWALIGIARRFGGILLSGRQVRVFVLIAGAAAALTGYLGAGVGVMEALALFLAGPGAMAIEELRKLIWPKKADPGIVGAKG